MAMTTSLQAWNSITATELPCTQSGSCLNNCSAPQASHFLSWGCVDIDLPQVHDSPSIIPPFWPAGLFLSQPLCFQSARMLLHAVRAGWHVLFRHFRNFFQGSGNKYKCANMPRMLRGCLLDSTWKKLHVFIVWPLCVTVWEHTHHYGSTDV